MMCGPGRVGAAAADTVVVPGQPTIVSAAGVERGVVVSFLPANDNGNAIIHYTAVCTDGFVLRAATGPSSPLTVSSLTDGTVYTCAVYATNGGGDGPGSSASAPVVPKMTLTYCTPGGTPLLMDLYRPSGPGPFPVVLHVHGGAWLLGDRNTFPSLSIPGSYTAAGFAWATIDYRLAPTYRFPAQIQDVACSVRFLRAHAAALNLDGSRIGAYGDSAGGHLVSLLATAPRSAGFDVGEYLDQSSRVQAVVDEFGITEFDAAYLAITPYVGAVFGTTDPDALRQYAPLTYVSADDPPFFIVQGALDTIVQPYQSQDLYDALRSVGVPADLLMVQHAGHELLSVDGPIVPSRAVVEADIVAAFKKYLNPTPSAPAAPSALPGNQSAMVRWTAPATDNGSSVLGYVVTPYTSGGPEASRVFSSTATSAFVTGLTGGTVYRFAVAAFNANGVGSLSLRSAAIVVGVPGAPSAPAASSGNGQATVRWTAPATDNGSPIAGYVVTPFVSGVARASRTFNSAATTAVVTGLRNGTTYAFAVAAFNANGVGPASPMTTSITIGAPLAPTGVTGVAGIRQATLSWTAPATDNGSPIAGYVVTPFVGNVRLAAKMLLGGSTSRTVTGLTTGTTYTFTVAAANANGTGPPSAPTAPISVR